MLRLRPFTQCLCRSQVHHFVAAVDNLRMATKYSFHVRPAAQKRLQAGGTRSSNARADFHDENNEIESGSGHLAGQSIVIPTKGCKWFPSII